MNLALRTKGEWIAAAFLVLLIVASLSAFVGIMLAMFGIGPREPWIWFSQRQYWTGAALTAAVGLFLLFRMSLRE